MGLFPHSFKFQMDPLYISWQLSRSRIEEEKKKKKRRVLDKESMQRGGGEWSAEWRGGQNGKHFLFFLFLFSPALFPLTPGLNPELLKKPLPGFRVLSLEWFVIMLALLQWRVCAYTG